MKVYTQTDTQTNVTEKTKLYTPYILGMPGMGGGVVGVVG